MDSSDAHLKQKTMEKLTSQTLIGWSGHRFDINSCDLILFYNPYPMNMINTPYNFPINRKGHFFLLSAGNANMFEECKEVLGSYIL